MRLHDLARPRAAPRRYCTSASHASASASAASRRETWNARGGRRPVNGIHDTVQLSRSGCIRPRAVIQRRTPIQIITKRKNICFRLRVGMKQVIKVAGCAAGGVARAVPRGALPGREMGTRCGSRGKRRSPRHRHRRPPRRGTRARLREKMRVADTVGHPCKQTKGSKGSKEERAEEERKLGRGAGNGGRPYRKVKRVGG
jgi:hypothetical protein